MGCNMSLCCCKERDDSNVNYDIERLMDPKDSHLFFSRFEMDLSPPNQQQQQKQKFINSVEYTDL